MLHIVSTKSLQEQCQTVIHRHEEATGGVLLLDDTISEKNYTDENAVNCWHFSHAKHRHVKGINLLSCLRYGDIALPIGYAVVNKNIVYSGIETHKQKRKSAITKNELFRSLVQQAVTTAYYLIMYWLIIVLVQRLI